MPHPGVARLVAPTAAVAPSFRAAMAEFRAEGRLGPDDDTELARALALAGDISDAAGFATLITVLRVRTRQGTEPDVPSTTRWLVRGPTFLGRISMRHRLTAELGIRGGHIGYDVRPSARRHGHATTMLRAALPLAARLGIDPALLTCDATNTASRRVIESAGGARQPGGGAHLRYLLPTT